MTDMRSLRTVDTRRGFKLIELAVAVGIIGILGGLGVSSSQQLVPRYRAQQAAAGLEQDIQLARQLATTHNREARIRFVEFDNAASNTASPNRGRYLIQLGNRAAASTYWDTLPLDDGEDTHTAEGTVDLSPGSDDYLKGISLEDWGTLDGPSGDNADALVFSPLGVISNPETDFADEGAFEVVFANKGDDTDRVAVRVYQGGMVRTAKAGGDALASEDCGEGC
jgi:Tfp pilus assembly protein PilE